MNATEMQDLDRWVAENIEGWTDIEWHQSHVEFPEKDPPPFLRGHHGNDFWRRVPRYTAEPAAAFEVLKKCAQRLGSTESISIRWDDGQWAVYLTGCREQIADTAEEAIAKFANALF